MNKRVPVSVALAITIIAMTVTFSITMIVSMSIFDDTVSSVVSKQAMYEKLSELDTYVRGNFFGEIDEVLLTDRLARGYVDGLGDKFSVYYSEKEFTEMQQIESGELVGIGISVLRNPEGTYRIVRVYSGSPAEKAGVTEGDTISLVDGIDVKTFATTRALYSALRGAPGTTLDLTCLRGADEEVVYSVQRVNYRSPTVEMRMTEGGYAYFRIYSFGTDTYTDFDFLLQQALGQNARGLVFDVRANAGGTFDSAYQMIDRLCPRGIVARSENRSGVTRLLATSDENEIDLPMVVLVNENTAAAAELFAVSIRDLSGGKVIGMTTLGRGTLQSTPNRLSDGSAVSITIARLLTGRDESFDGVGVLPDIEVAPKNADEALLLSPDISPTSQDEQIIRALEAVRAMARGEGLDDGSPPVSGSESGASVPALAPTSTSPSGDASAASGSASASAGASSSALSSEALDETA